MSDGAATLFAAPYSPPHYVHAMAQLRKGDRLTITRSTTLWLTRFDSLKPSVTLSREIGDDPQADQDEMELICYVELRRAMLTEIRNRNKFEKLTGEENEIGPVVKHCKRVVQAGYGGAAGFTAKASGRRDSETSGAKGRERRRSVKRRDGVA